jgi:hypothetical protein
VLKPPDRRSFSILWHQACWPSISVYRWAASSPPHPHTHSARGRRRWAQHAHVRAHTHTPRTVALLLWKCGWTELLFPFTEQPYTHTQLNTPATATATLRLKSKCVQQGAAATTGCALCT